MKIRRLILASLFILSIICISIYGGTISYAFFYAVLLIPILSFTYLFYVYLRFAVHQEIKTRNIVAGVPVPYGFFLCNEGYTAFTSVAVNLHSDYSTVLDVNDNDEFHLFPRDKMYFDTNIICKYRGEYDVGVKKLIITDFFGIFRVSYKMPTTIRAIVKPRIIKLDSLDDIPESETHVQSYLKEVINEQDVTSRNYTSGDSMKRIHWKLTAKSGELKVRNEIGTLKKKILLMTDFERVSDDMHEYLPLENQIIEQTIALLYYFVRHSIPAEVIFSQNEMENRNISDISDFNNLYEELAVLNFRRDKSFIELFSTASLKGFTVSATIIIMVIRELSAEIFSEITVLSLSGKILIVYVISDVDISDYIRQGNDRLKIIRMTMDD
ncbi:MAG: DUF58 domain-containing protein [Lachnospiraceae bacterium]|nr:DUF58 domain-containing protein [Lachnospiraceae bacterium]